MALNTTERSGGDEADGGSAPTAQQILDKLLDQGKEWIDADTTTDRITHGPADRRVTRAAVSWMGTNRIIEQAGLLGVELLVVHECIIWQHMDQDERSFDHIASSAKRSRLDELGITVLRCHDLWDRYPGVGVCETWPRTLGFTDYRVEKYSNGQICALCRLPEGTRLKDVARQIAARTAHLGQQQVAAVGDPEMPVRRLVTNVGAWGSNPPLLTEAFRDMKADAFVASEFCWWRDASYALDCGIGLIHVNHGVSEADSIKELHNHLREHFPQVGWHYLQEASPYQMFGA